MYTMTKADWWQLKSVQVVTAILRSNFGMRRSRMKRRSKRERWERYYAKLINGEGRLSEWSICSYIFLFNLNDNYYNYDECWFFTVMIVQTSPLCKHPHRHHQYYCCGVVTLQVCIAATEILLKATQDETFTMLEKKMTPTTSDLSGLSSGQSNWTDEVWIKE